MLTDEQRAKAKAYVVMDEPDSAYAACVIDGVPAKVLRKFLSEHAGADIRTVPVEQARLLLSTYFERREAAEPKLL